MMAILRTREVWKRPRARRAISGAVELTDAERENIRAAMRHLMPRFGNWSAMARALRVSRASVSKTRGRRGKPSAAMAVRLARLAEVPLEDILSGAWVAGAPCPMCGRAAVSS